MCIELETLKDCHKYKLIGNAIGIPILESIFKYLDLKGNNNG